jgi:hypothetical protein
MIILNIRTSYLSKNYSPLFKTDHIPVTNLTLSRFLSEGKK